MHLSALDPAVKKPNARLYREDIVGKPGQTYGSEPGIHFEICCNEANLEALLRSMNESRKN